MKHWEKDFYKNVPQTIEQLKAENSKPASKFVKKRFTKLLPTDKLGKVLKFRSKNAHILPGNGNSDN